MVNSMASSSPPGSSSHSERKLQLHRPVINLAAQALAQILHDGRHADRVIERAFKLEKNMGARDRKQFAELIYDLVRWFRRLSHALGRSEGAEPANEAPPSAEELWLWIGAYLLGRAQETGAEPALPAWSEFDPIAKNPAWRKQILERLRMADSVPRAVRESVPDWLDRAGSEELGEKWPAVLHALNEPAPVTLRANALKCTPEQLRARLLEENEIASAPAAETDCGLTLEARANVFRTDAFKEGWFEMQDSTSQHVAGLVACKPGDRVIDACAGAGGKTLAIGARMRNKGRLVALDVEQRRLDELRRRATRAGLDCCETRLIDSAKVIKRLENSADWLLLDVPCSGLGVLRRNPDRKWKLQASDLERLRLLQSQILDDYAAMVKLGGHLVYATCSVLPSENQDQVAAFLKRRSTSTSGGQFELLSERTFTPGENGGDGFYAAVLRRDR